MRHRTVVPGLCLLATLVIGPAPCAAQRSSGGAPGRADGAMEVALSGDLELVRLVELVSQRLGVSVQYQAADLNRKVTLRLREPLDDAALWQALLSTLETQGLTVVELEHGGVYRVTPMAQAAAQHQRLVLPGELDAALALDPPDGVRAGYFAAVVRLREARPEDAIAAIQPVLSAQGSVARALPPSPGVSGRLLFIADVRRRVEQALALIELIDAPAERAARFVVELRHVAPATAATTATQALLAETAGAPGARGPGADAGAQFIPLPDGARLMVIAPPGREHDLRALLAELDVAEALETRAYAAPGVTPDDLASSLRELLVARAGDAAAPQRAARVYADRLTGSAMATATLRDHERIEAFVARVAEAPPGALRGLRAFTIRNRDASDLASTLNTLLASGAIDQAPPGSFTPAPGSSAPAPGSTAPAPGSTAPGSPPENSSSGVASRGAALTGAAASTDASASSRSRRALEGVWIGVDAQTNSVIAVGEPGPLRQLEELITALDRRQPQVMIEVTLVSLDDSQALSFGVELRTQFERGDTSVNLASLFGLSMADMFNAGTGFTGTVLRPGDYQVVVRALETVNAGRSSSAPKALVNNNATATIRAVARQPFTSINASQTVATTSFGGTQDAGTTVRVTPKIAEGDHLALEYAVELSAFTGPPITTAEGGIIPPPSQQNALDGSVTIPDGYTIVLGGLEVVTRGEGKSRVPVLGGIPILGALFGTTSESSQRTRFYVFLRATILRDPGFEDLRLLSARDVRDVGVPGGTPRLEARWID